MFFILSCIIGALACAPVLLGAPAVPLNHTDMIRQFESQRPRVLSLDADSSHSYDMLSLSMELNVETGWSPLTGWADLTMAGVQDQNEIAFNAVGLTVFDVFVNASAVPFVHENDTLHVQRFLGAGDTVTVAMNMSVPPVGTPWDLGYHVGTDHVYTFAEPWGARRWFPCYDQPFDKIDDLTIAVNMPSSWSLAANGVLVSTTYPEPGRKREVYYHHYPISTYLVMMSAGNFSRQIFTQDGVQYRYFALPGDSADAAYDWERTPQMVDVFAERFGDYPFDEYGMVQSEIMGGWGAMEHQTFTTYGYQLVNGHRTYEDVVSHELAHMWFGDDLSPVDFRNMWLNEGFATFAGTMFYEVVNGEEFFESVMVSLAGNYFDEDEDFRYAMYDPPEDYLFGAVEYQKGAWVLLMLRDQIMGDSLFYAAMRAYTDAHHGGTVNTEDFIEVVNRTAGQDLHWFFDQWVYQAGHPELQIDIQRRVPTDHDVTVHVRQVQTNAPAVFRFPLSIDVRTQEGTTTRVLWFDQQDQTHVMTFPATIMSANMHHFQPLLYVLAPLDATDPAGELPLDISLGDVYPNPFNSSARVPFELSVPTRVRLSLYDVTGRRVRNLKDAVYTAGRHEFMFTADASLASGLYLVSLEAAGVRKMAKAVLIK